jgi:hypothetical protein
VLLGLDWFQGCEIVPCVRQFRWFRPPQGVFGSTKVTGRLDTLIWVGRVTELCSCVLEVSTVVCPWRSRSIGDSRMWVVGCEDHV